MRGSCAAWWWPRRPRLTALNLDDLNLDAAWADERLALLRKTLPGLQNLTAAEFSVRGTIILAANLAIRRVC